MSENAGLYIHIPFCVKKCPYCGFYSITDTSLADSFAEALEKEMELVSQTPLFFDTLYFGGGTPSVLEGHHMARFISNTYRFFQIQRDPEITIEINPGTVTADKLKAYKNSGINRVSIGIQSFQDSHLNFLGRIHSVKDACDCIKLTRQAGFDNMALDLIFGIPGQTETSWVKDLKRALEYNPEHLSCYMLTFEPGTPMDNDRLKGMFKLLSDKTGGRLFETTLDVLDSHGYRQYEISNFARTESTQSRHNRKYWSFAPYLGLGPAAHSFINDERFWNHRDVMRYIHDLKTGKLPVAEKEKLTREQQIIEAISLGLRKTEGISVTAFDNKFNIDFNRVFEPLIADLSENGHVKSSKDRCALTRRGMLFLDSIIKRFVYREF